MAKNLSFISEKKIGILLPDAPTIEKYFKTLLVSKFCVLWTKDWVEVRYSA